MKKGKLIAIEGLDGCGKQTQSELLKKNLEALGYEVRLISAPYYGKWHCIGVEKHLKGEFCSDLEKHNPYKIANLYALDRLGAYEEDWKKDYEEGKIIICDRYVGSNMMYQVGRLEDKEEKDKLIEWIDELEYKHNELPKPDMNIFLSVSPEESARLRVGRASKVGMDGEDTYEKNLSLLVRIYENAHYIIERLGWECIACDDKETGLKCVEAIQEVILDKVKGLLERKG